MEHRDRREVEGVSRVVREGPYAPLAEDDPLVSARHDILCAHQKLFQSVGKAPFQKYGLVELSHLAEQVVVLHVPCPYLDDVDILEEIDIHYIHELGDYGKPRFRPRDLQKLQSLGLESREIVGRGARLEGPASDHVGSRGLYGLRDFHYLLLALDRAGAGDQDEITGSDLNVPDFYDRIVRVEFPVDTFEGLRDLFYGLYYLQTLQQLRIHLRGVPDEA